MKLSDFLQKLRDTPGQVEFPDTMAVIDALYEFTPVTFRNGNLVNQAGTNSGSCKLFSFAGLHGLSQQQTLDCFGTYYRDDVLKHPDGTDHQNIRNFSVTGWEGIVFDACALAEK
ncbi:MAG TPA: type III effector [Gallionella sp.]|jgi:hypothetical protein|nr:HopJ type III effector protein [Gallionella sp.]OGS68465.1 MAG: type III effector [Gallionellales bacterium GWA2_54_124]OGT20121.1 MAG: type III effector [Gallionellales bacterium RIFOXYD12_FULL_53_10]OGT36117.1 MAG: type III effector [Gallionellales bacterium RIFOXYD2_FULL_52_7]HCI54189.1 type III effector [Gallionella sp.]